MARRFAVDIDLLKFSLLNAMLHPVSADPSGLGAGDEGRVWHNTTTHKFMYWSGTAAIDLSARSSHTGTQTASTISDLAATVKAYRLDEFASPNTDVSMASHKLVNVLDPDSQQDAATKGYVDNALAGLSNGLVLKGAVRAAATTNISISSAPATIDGVTPEAGDVFLLTGQTTGTQNGPYVWASAGSAMTRAANWDTSGEAVLGSFWIVQEGTNADVLAVLTNDTDITLGTTVPAFTFRGSAGATYTAGNGLTLSGTEFNVGQGAGITVSADAVAVDTAVVERKVGGVIPTTTTGIFTVSGAVVTVNHAFANYTPDVVVRAYTSPASGYTQGQRVEVDEVATDQNNVQLTFPAAPASNNWVVTVTG